MTTETSKRVVEYARERLKHEIGDLLEDPSWLTSMPEELIADYFKEKRLLAADLGLDFDMVLDETGTEHQRSRLRRLERSAGVSPPGTAGL